MSVSVCILNSFLFRCVVPNARHAYRTISIINRLDLASFDVFDVAAIANPFRAERRRPAVNIDIYIRIAQGPLVS